MGRATCNGNEANSKMKQPSDMSTPRGGGSDLCSNTLPLDRTGAPIIIDRMFLLINRHSLNCISEAVGLLLLEMTRFTYSNSADVLLMNLFSFCLICF